MVEDATSVYAWVSYQKSPAIIGAVLRLEVKDSIDVDLSDPRLLTGKGRLIADYLHVWEIDTIDGGRRSLVNISGFTKFNRSGGRLSLGSGVYLAQVVVFLDFHPELRGTSTPMVVQFGHITMGDEVMVLRSVGFEQTQSEGSATFGSPPEGSRLK
ncbi:MAG: hypothetical protein ABII79_02140 [bacterium]